jgi:hypothetical protein
MRGRDQLYFVSAIGAAGYLQPGRALGGGERFRTIPTLHPRSPRPLEPGEPLELPLRVGAEPGPEAEMTLHLLADVAEAPAVTLNGVELAGESTAHNWFAYPVPVGTVSAGENAATVTAHRPPERTEAWDVEWECDTDPPVPWSGGAAQGCEATMQDGVLLIADRSTERRSYLYYGFPWMADPEASAAAEFRVKVISGRSGVIIADGVAEEVLHLYPDRIALDNAEIEHEMDTTGAFHDYRVEIEGEDIRVYVDDALALDGVGTFTTPAHSGRNVLSFGASSSGTTGEALWERVRVRSGGATTLYDLLLEVDYPEPDGG